MINLLAILLSMAMMLTGAPDGELAEPVGKTLLIDNIEVEYGYDSVSLDSTVTLGVRTDGKTAGFEFFVNRGDEKLMPLQMTVDGEKLLISDTKDTTLKLTNEDLQSLMNSVGGVGSVGESEVFGMLDDTAAVYREMFALARDPEAMKAFKAEAEKIYDEVVDRGEGKAEQLIYQGETLNATSYEYDIDAKTLGTLTERIYASNEALSRYGEAYLKMLNSAEGTGLEGVDSFTALYEKMDVHGHIAESIAENGVKVQDGTLTITVPQIDKTLQFEIYSEKQDEYTSGTVSSEFELEGVTWQLYCDSTEDAGDLQYSMTLTGNAADGKRYEGEEADEDAGATGAVDAGEGEPDGGDFAGRIADGTADAQSAAVAKTEAAEGDGEGDNKDLYYITMDFSYVPGESLYFDYSLDTAEGEGASFVIESEPGEDETVTHVSFSHNASDNDVFAFDFDVHARDGLFDVNVTEDGATSLMENPAALLTLVSEDAMKLYGYEDIQTLVRMAQRDRSTEETGITVEEIPEEDEAEEDEEDAEDAEEAESAFELSNPEFTYLPEGFSVTDTIVDEENQFVSLTVSNGDVNIYVSIGNTQISGDITHYVLDGTEEINPLSGMLVTREDNGDYVMYTADDGVANYSVFPDGGDVDTEEILKMLAGIQFS